MSKARVDRTKGHRDRGSDLKYHQLVPVPCLDWSQDNQPQLERAGTFRQVVGLGAHVIAGPISLQFCKCRSHSALFKEEIRRQTKAWGLRVSAFQGGIFW